MKKKDILSLVANSTRLTIIRRLAAARKAAYSDLMDSVDYIQPLNSTGNLNYHINFLLKTEIIRKDGSIYRLTDNGQEILRFVEDTEDRWQELQRSLSGDIMNVLSYAEQFEDETGIKMEKAAIDFHGFDMIMDENRIIGILHLGNDIKVFEEYSLLDSDGFSISKREYANKDGSLKQIPLLCHPKLEYELFPKWFGAVQDYLERNLGDVLVYAIPGKPSPFLLRADELGRDGFGISFVVAPSVVDEKLRNITPSKE
ncbi:MAG: hypothetical protein EAX81_01960 [Candidatus Thorarchaeota archaeon]|nr:hypothetical protein [Candidatus Thorarchaeota archaeon]